MSLAGRLEPIAVGYSNDRILALGAQDVEWSRLQLCALVVGLPARTRWGDVRGGIQSALNLDFRTIVPHASISDFT
jgi:hypothetical protein